MNERLKRIFMSVNPEDAAEAGTCFEKCPLRHGCALWLWDAWNVNNPMCDCTDERLIWLENSFNPDFDLMKKWIDGKLTPDD